VDSSLCALPLSFANPWRFGEAKKREHKATKKYPKEVRIFIKYLIIN
jgi:hypothetical protein